MATAASVTALAIPAGAATTAGTASKGAATSSLTILEVALGTTTVSLGEVAAATSNATHPNKAELVITPLDSSVTGAVGRQTVTSGTATVPSVPASTSLPGGLGSVTGPTLKATAENTSAGPLATAALQAIGTVKVLSLPVDLKAASLSDVSKVTGSAATAQKTLTLGSLSLPSIQDLLAGLGVNLNALLGKLTQGKLTDLAGLVTSTATGAVATANSAVDAAQAKVSGTVPQTLDQAQSSLTAAKTAATTAQATLNTATAAFSAALAKIPALTLAGTGVTTGTTADQFLALNLSSVVLTALNTAAGANLTDLATAVKTAETALTAANAVVDEVQTLVNALVQLVTSVLNAVTSNDDPLAALGNVKVVSSAVAAKTPTAKADVSVGSVHVLGAAADLNSLTSVLGTVTGTLSSVLSSVGAQLTPPSIAVGKPATSTRHSGTTQFAAASITGVTVTLPTLTLPSALALPGAPKAIGGSLTLGQLGENAQWTPAVAPTKQTQQSTPHHPSSGKNLPDTGARMLLSIVGAALIGIALVARRRFAHAG